MPNDADKLQRAAHHVAHDIWMLREASKHLTNSFAYTAWFIHCRSVMEFFGERKQGNDDIHVSDFLTQGVTWAGLKQGREEPEGYRDIRTAVNKLAAHLTYSRLGYEKGGQYADRGRPSQAITDYLWDLTVLFLDALPPERKAWFAGVRS